jgi:hypothetical protein
MVYVGSGGSYTGGIVASQLHWQMARKVSRVLTPLEAGAHGDWSNTAVILLSAGGNNPDVLSSKVLVCGGLDSLGNALSSCELYNPATGVFTAAASMSGQTTRQRFLPTARCSLPAATACIKAGGHARYTIPLQTHSNPLQT